MGPVSKWRCTCLLVAQRLKSVQNLRRLIRSIHLQGDAAYFTYFKKYFSTLGYSYTSKSHLLNPQINKIHFSFKCYLWLKSNVLNIVNSQSICISYIFYLQLDL